MELSGRRVVRGGRVVAGLAALGVWMASFGAWWPVVDAEADDTGTMELTGQLGLMTFEGDSRLDPDLFAGGRFGYYFTDNVAAEVSLFVGNVDVDGSSKDADVLVPALEGTYTFLKGRLQPFAAAGLGVVVIDGREGDDSTGVAFPIGGGVKYLITDDLAARADARWIFNTAGGDDLNEGQFLFGLAYRFGGRSETPPARELPVVAPPPAAPPVRTQPRQPFAEEGRVLEQKGQVSINLLVNFDFDKADIKAQYKKRLDEFAQFMKAHPNTVAEIEGHTDHKGTKAYNDKLSQRRADSIRSYLVEHGGVASGRVRAHGYGFAKPVASNSNDEGRAKNRRVIGTVKKK